MITEGKAHCFGKNIDTDQIYPGRYLDISELIEISHHAMEGVDATFAREFQAGNVMVAGTNFGCGSSREHAAICLKELGVGVVIAESFARIFFRNAINLGLPVLVCPKIGQHVENGDTIQANLTTGLVTNLSKGTSFQGEPLSGFVLNIINSGGIKQLMKEKVASGKV